MDGNNMNKEYDVNQSASYDFDYDDYEEYNPQGDSNGLAITGMVLGICALVFYWLGSCCTPILGGALAILLGIVGLVFSIIAMKKGQNKGMSIAGLICSIFALLTGIGALIAMVLVLGGAIGMEFLLGMPSYY